MRADSPAMHRDDDSRDPAPPTRKEGHVKRLRDAVHGDILLGAAELELLDTPQMQRLRGIRQLGAAYYVYPAAQHTRFEHCLGTCWTAKQIVSRIESQASFRFPELEKRAIFLAALVHDVTHIPFGHTFEDERKLLARHDESERRHAHFFERGELSEALHRDEAGRLALRIVRPGAALPAGLSYLRQIVSGTICADLLDYLKRDNYFCGLSQHYDPRVLDYFTVAGGELVLDLQHQGLFRHDALSEITNLLRIRYVLSERVYYHHAKIACGVMISKAIERAMTAGLTEEELCQLTDDALLYHLRERYSADRCLLELVDELTARQLFKRCYMLTRRVGADAVHELVRKFHLNENGARATAEQRIAAALGAAPHEVALYCAPEQMTLKEAEVPVILGGGKLGRLSDLSSAEIRVLKDQHRELWCTYVFVSRRLAQDVCRAGNVCEEVVGFPNELPDEMRGRLA
jgi:hypothetical protein